MGALCALSVGCTSVLGDDYSFDLEAGGSAGASGSGGAGGTSGQGGSSGASGSGGTSTSCGDGIIQAGEECDGTNVAGLNCTTAVGHESYTTTESDVEDDPGDSDTDSDQEVGSETNSSSGTSTEGSTEYESMTDTLGVGGEMIGGSQTQTDTYSDASTLNTTETDSVSDTFDDASDDDSGDDTYKFTAPKSGRGNTVRLLTVAIDPGHGGEDPGAIGGGGTYEKHIALDIAKKLRANIDGAPNMRAMMTRDADFFVPLNVRVQKARRVGADLFVSIHADAFTTPPARGSSVFALSDHGATSAQPRPSTNGRCVGLGGTGSRIDMYRPASAGEAQSRPRWP